MTERSRGTADQRYPNTCSVSRLYKRGQTPFVKGYVVESGSIARR
jgi:hypothetical protein